MAEDETEMGVPAPEGAAAPISTEFELGRDNIEGRVGRFGFDIHNPVFMISSIVIVALIIFTLAFHGAADSLFSWLFASVTREFDWFFLSAANIFVLFCLFLIVSPWGKVRLGGSDATTDKTN